MTAVVRVKNGVEFSTIGPSGFRMLGAVDRVARAMEQDLTITSACDGEHSGPTDPHHFGEAYDIRTKTLSPEQKGRLVSQLRAELGERFTVLLEDLHGPNEHCHIQRKKGTVYP